VWNQPLLLFWSMDLHPPSLGRQGERGRGVLYFLFLIIVEGFLIIVEGPLKE
jgi:hypothetical protein